MSRAYNFSPGPAGVADEVMQAVQAEFCEYGSSRASIAELSHRGEAFMAIAKEAEALLRELLAVPDDYIVLFLSGGATGQGAAVPLNLLGDKRQAAYAITGHWSKRMATEAERYCAVHIAADTGDSNYTQLPAVWDIPADAAYLHYVSNETVHGVEFFTPPDTALPLVADMSSNILSRRICAADYAVIYAGAQKNIGIAGVTVVIVNPAVVVPHKTTPSVWNYAKQAQAQSMYNTPPVFQVYLTMQVLRWVKQQGGILAMEEKTEQKARLLYDCLDNSNFYQTPVAPACRSRNNVPFFLPEVRLTSDFLAGAEAQGMIGLKGHKVLGGCRASLYNAMPFAGVCALTEYMREFERLYG